MCSGMCCGILCVHARPLARVRAPPCLCALLVPIWHLCVCVCPFDTCSVPVPIWDCACACAHLAFAVDVSPFGMCVCVCPCVARAVVVCPSPFGTVSSFSCAHSSVMPFVCHRVAISARTLSRSASSSTAASLLGVGILWALVMGLLGVLAGRSTKFVAE